MDLQTLGCIGGSLIWVSYSYGYLVNFSWGLLREIISYKLYSGDDEPGTDSWS